MEVLVAILAVALLVVVILVVSAPLRAAWSSQDDLVGGTAAPGEGRDDPVNERVELDDDGVESAAKRGALVGDLLALAEEQAELEAEREAKYREIRDTELDYRTGKLSKEDFAATDSALRAEAVEILHRLAALEDEGATESEGATPRDA
jgi:septal ring factor EnvC (AmiA/AmiB activator)